MSSLVRRDDRFSYISHLRDACDSSRDASEFLLCYFGQQTTQNDTFRSMLLDHQILSERETP